jgi:hypothetical protein
MSMPMVLDMTGATADQPHRPPHSAMRAGAVARRRHRSQPSGILVAKDWDSYSTHDSW